MVTPEAKHKSEMFNISTMIEIERHNQFTKWGIQNHNPGQWQLILQEELGEYAKEVLENNRENAIKELIQVAAVAHAMLHNLYYPQGENYGQPNTKSV